MSQSGIPQKVYPLRMYHPNARKAKIIPIETFRENGTKIVDYKGTSDIFPPVTVSTAQQEELHRAKGYLADNEVPTAATFAEYPMILRHPEYRPAVEEVPQITDRAGNIVRAHVPAVPEHMPDKTVGSPSERVRWEEQGWRAPGQSDAYAAANARAVPYNPNATVDVYPQMLPDGSVKTDPAQGDGPDKYPMWLYDRTVNNAAEERALRIAQGETVEEPIQPDPEEIKRRRREDLLAQLAELDGDSVAAASAPAAGSDSADDHDQSIDAPVKRPPGRPRKVA